MEAIRELLAWAEPAGIKLNGIGPQEIAGRGIGLVARREIQPNEVVLEVPLPCLRTLDTVPKPLIRKLPPKISVHGLLAADMLLDSCEDGQYAPVWNAVCPSPEDLSTAPLLWPEQLQYLLPSAARDLLEKQKTKFAKDWAGVRPTALTALGTTTNEDVIKARYLHAWLLVNTRTFYYTNTKIKKRPREAHMALQPVADLFNHTDDDSATCKVSFDYKGFNFKATRKYESGEEVHICYGRHGNDKLLVEYGFAMEDNRWDEVSLDEVLLPKFNKTQEGVLGEFGFLGRYALDRNDVCYRTQVAVRQICCKPGEWRRFVDGADDGESSQGRVDEVLLSMLKDCRETAERAVESVEGLSVGSQDQRDMLVSRWMQIRGLLQVHIDRLGKRLQG